MPVPDDRPEIDGRSRDESFVKTNDGKVVVKILPPATVQRVARNPEARDAFSPAAGPAEIAARLIGQENIASTVEALVLPLEPPCATSQLFKVRVVRDDDQKLHILGIGFAGHDRANQRDSLHTRDGGRRSKEPCDFRKHLDSQVGAMHRRNDLLTTDRVT
jgi:hypothetical protein